MKCKLNALENKNILATMLGVDRKTLLHMSKSTDNLYNEFTSYEGGKPRQVQEPKSGLKVIHKILKCILNDMDLPDYLLSGRKGLSYVDNAEVHVGSSYLVKMDIEKFFPSCRREFVYRFFRYRLKTSSDVAEILTNLTTFKGVIPTGSPVSQILAFLIHQDVFDKCAEYAKKRGYLFSLYVDDLCFSGDDPRINGHISVFVNAELKRKSLKLKRKKVISYGAGQPKLLTGVILSDDGQMLAPNKLKKKTFSPIRKVNGDLNRVQKNSARSVFGRVQAIRQIQGKTSFTQLHSGLLKSLGGYFND